MSIKHILLPLTGDPGCADAAICGLTLAKQLGAHVTAAYEDELGPLYSTPDMAPSALSYGIFYEQLQEIRKERKAKARTYFDRAVGATKLPIVSAPVCEQGSTMWIDEIRGGEYPISRFGALTDLVILEAPGNRNSFPTSKVIEEALFSAHRATLVVPAGTKAIDFSKILVAWNGSVEAANAVEHALDLLPRNAEITVLQIGEVKPGRLPGERLMDYLGWHCFDAELRRLPDRANETSQIILDEARRVGAGCIVMGAYTHSRTREMLLGGVTEFMLRNTLHPLLMAH